MNASPLKSLLIASSLLCAGILLAADDGPCLLSDNLKPGSSSQAFPEGACVVQTGASYEWVVEGAFASDPETVKTGSRPDGTSKCLFDGRVKGGDTQSFSAWGGGRWATLRIDLKGEYIIEEVDVWALRDQQRDTESVEILLSSDGKSFTSQGFAKNTEAPRDSKDFVKLAGKLDKPVLARHLELRAKRLDSAMQQQLAEIAVWGRRPPEDKTKIAKANERPAVKSEVRCVQDGAALVAWKGFAKGASEALKWRVYFSDKAFSATTEEGVKLFKELPKGESSLAVFPFEPGSTVHFGVSAVYPEGEGQSVESQPCKFRTPYQCDNFGEMIAINHFWSGTGYGGGGANVKKDKADQWNEVALDILAETPARESRWWMMSPEVVKKFLSRGIGMITFPRDETIKQANSLGLHSFSAGNEPEFHRKPEEYLASLKEIHAKAKEASKWNCVSAPTTNLYGTALEWLDKFYAAGAKEHFDVLDLHTYSGATGASVLPKGYPKGAPEALIDDMRKVREIAAKYGDQAKPVISTEFGYCDSPGASNPAGEMTPLRKAQYLTRGLILHYVLGFKRVYVYSFWDEGTDVFYKEHVYGIVDYDLQKKPAFHALNALAAQLGDCVLDRELEGCEKPSFGYLFKSAKGGYVAVVWDGSGENVGSFATDAAQASVADIFGKSRSIVLEKGGSFSLPYGLSPAYIRSAAPVRLVSCKRAETQDLNMEESLSASLGAKSLIVASDAKAASVELSLKNGFKKALDCKVAVKALDGALLGEMDVKASGNSVTKVKAEFKTPETQEALFPVDAFISYKTESSSYSDALRIYVRRLAKAERNPVCVERRFNGIANPVFALANKELELSFDPAQGGRMIDFIDKGSMTNQILMDYEKAGSLKSFAFEYTWLDIEGLKNEPWTASSNGESLELRAFNAKKGLDAKLRWSLDGESPALKLEVELANKSGKQAKGKIYFHPEYKLSGLGRSFSDILLFPTKEGVFKMAFWTCLGERKTPELNANWWAVQDTVGGLELKQAWPEGWKAPRVWFGNDFYNLEMTREFELAPGEALNSWLDWSLKRFEPQKTTSKP